MSSAAAAVATLSSDGRLDSEHCLDVRVLALLRLENRATGVRRAQTPLHIVAVFALFRQRLARADRLEVKAVDEFLGGANFD